MFPLGQIANPSYRNSSFPRKGKKIVRKKTGR